MISRYLSIFKEKEKEKRKRERKRESTVINTDFE